MVDKQLNASLNSVAIMLPRKSKNGVACETDDRENYTSIEDGSDWLTNASSSIIQTDYSGYDEILGEIVIEALETEPTDDKTSAENGASSNANLHEIESDTIITQNISDTYISIDG